MTARTVELDAATVYADGVLRGLVMAAGVLGKDDWSQLPAPLRRLLAEWRDRAKEFQVKSDAGHACDLPHVPLTETEASLIAGAFVCPHCKKGLSLWR